MKKKKIILHFSKDKEPHEDQMIAAYYLFDEVNINTIKALDTIKEPIQSAVKLFTDAIIKIIKPG